MIYLTEQDRYEYDVDDRCDDDYIAWNSVGARAERALKWEMDRLYELCCELKRMTGWRWMPEDFPF